MRYCLQYNNNNNNNTIITLRRGGDCRFFANEETVGIAVTYTTYLHLAGGIITVTRRRRDEALECIFEACQQSSSRKYTLPRALLLYSKYIYGFIDSTRSCLPYRYLLLLVPTASPYNI